jgi:hypothetical protein
VGIPPRPENEHLQWGGRRAGSGRKPRDPERGAIGPPHRARPTLEERGPVRARFPIRDDLPSLLRADLHAAMTAALDEVPERGGFKPLRHSIDAKHVTIVVEASGKGVLARGLRAVGVRIARAVNRTLDRTGQVLASRYEQTIL